MKIQKLFIANRGELACRIARTARKLGIQTCGVYTPQDARSKHVRDLNEVRQLPWGDLSENYLNMDLLIRIAKEFSADAVHPGYGFLAENYVFAQKVIDAGLIWVGPGPEAMERLGGKISAKEIAQNAGVPVTPWSKLNGKLTKSKIEAVLDEVGLPLLIKAAHGGGGRGQRIVQKREDFVEALRTAQSEAERSFGSAEVFVERFLDRPRHIEVQVIGDAHGHLFALGERDCTVQRRNQKIIEEAPASILDEVTRREILSAAISLAKAVNYTNAGTIEFLAQKNDSSWEFFFMELNARLQVEHPVSEMIWNVDLVDLQIKAAEGQDLTPVFQNLPPQPLGHAIELRLCAEDPVNHFLPSPGPITDWVLPVDETVRIETGFEIGDTIAHEYDSLFAKVIVCKPSREEAILYAQTFLENMRVGGIITNKYFLQNVLAHPDFRENHIFTRWIDGKIPSTASEDFDHDLVYWAKRFSTDLFVQRMKKYNTMYHSEGKLLTAFHPGEDFGSISPQGFVRIIGSFETPDGSNTASGWVSRTEICISFNRELQGIGQRKLSFAGRFDIDDLKAHHGPIVAQVPGIVLDVRAKVEDVVEAQSPILVIEAMKIEMPMSLPMDAKITAIHVKRGDRIQPGQTLVAWEPLG